MTAPTVLLYVSSSFAACLVYLTHRSVRRLIEDTRRLQHVFPKVQLRLRHQPLALSVGSTIPDFRVFGIDYSVGPIDRGMLMGDSTVLLLFEASQLEQWAPQGLMGVLGSLRGRIGGRVYLIVRAAKDLDLTCAPLQALRDSRLREEVVLAADDDGSLWNGLALHWPLAPSSWTAEASFEEWP